MISIQVDGSRVQGRLRQIQAALGDTTQAMRTIGEIVVRQIHDSFERQASPAGAQWRRLSQRTLMARAGYGKGKRIYNKDGNLSAAARRRVQSAQILIDTGRLRKSFSIKVGADAVVVGTAEKQAQILNFGGRAGRGRRVVIPARPFMPDGETLDWREIRTALLRYL